MYVWLLNKSVAKLPLSFHTCCFKPNAKTDFISYFVAIERGAQCGAQCSAKHAGYKKCSMITNSKIIFLRFLWIHKLNERTKQNHTTYFCIRWMNVGNGRISSGKFLSVFFSSQALTWLRLHELQICHNFLQKSRRLFFVFPASMNLFFRWSVSLHHLDYVMPHKFKITKENRFSYTRKRKEKKQMFANEVKSNNFFQFTWIDWSKAVDSGCRSIK